jgi:mRNA deadenylase 3'-5' endonuclease subunit Ccr4
MLINSMGQTHSNNFPTFDNPQLTKDSEPPACKLLNMPFHYKNESFPHCQRIRVCSFNILAQCYIYPDCGEFSQASFYQSEPGFRASMLRQVITNIDPDILCLQEVDNPISQPLFQALGKKYRMASFTRPRGKQDGNTIAFDKKRFYEVAKGCIDFNQMALQTQFKNDEGFQTNNICVWVKLRDNLTQQDVYVYNAHFFWNPKRDDVKYFQLGILLNIILKKLSMNELVIIGGDLNSCPISNTISLLQGSEPTLDRIEVRDGNEQNVLKNCKSIYEYIDKGKLDQLGLTNAYSLYTEIAPKDPIDYSIFQHKVFGFKKGYPPFSNYSKDFKATIDHIIFSGRFKLSGLLGLPTLGDLNGTVALPNIYFPSDHLPIAADLYYSASL